MPSTEERVDHLYLLLSDVLGKIKDLRGDMALLRQGGLETETVAVAEGTAIVFLDAAATVTTATTVSAFAAYNAAGIIPVGAKGVILEIVGRTFNATQISICNVRKDSTSIEVQAWSIESQQSNNEAKTTNQHFCEVTTSRTFDWNLASSDPREFSLKVVGYWT